MSDRIPEPEQPRPEQSDARADASPDSADPSSPRAAGSDAAGADEPGAAELIGQSLAAAAKRGGLGAIATGESPSGTALLGAMGGIRGLCEAILPGLVFIVLFTIFNTGPLKAHQVPISLGASVAVALVFTIVRIATRSQPTQAVIGLVGVGASAILAIVTGKPVNNFLLGLIIDAAYGIAFLISVLVRWPIIGLVVGYLTGDGLAWRSDPLRYRAMLLASWCWVGLFAARLVVQVPLLLANNVTALGITHLVMGVPLYVPLLIVTWLFVRTANPSKPAPDAS